MNGKRVLVIEDTLLNLELVADVLEAAGAVVLKADNAEDGLTLARDQRPDVVLMDISLPAMDGLTATRALKADAATRRIPVIALTAHAMKGDLERSLEAGCAGVLTKPIDTRSFCQRIRDILTADPPSP